MWGRGAEHRTRGRRRASEAEGNLRLEAPFGSHGFLCFFWLVKDFQRSAHRLGSAGNAVICLSMNKHLEEERTTTLLIAWSRWSVLLFRPIYFRTAEMNSLLVANVVNLLSFCHISDQFSVAFSFSCLYFTSALLFSLIIFSESRLLLSVISSAFRSSPPPPPRLV